MFKSRAKTTAASSARQRPVVKIAVTHSQLPLQDANSTERWCTLFKDFENIIERVLNFEVRDNDVFLVGFFKCGNTWMHETLWQLLNGLDLDYKTNKIGNHKNFMDVNGWFPEMADILSKFDKLQGGRLLQTHLPASLLPQQLWQKKTKTVYVARNVKDVVVSAYHFVQWVNLWSGTMNEFVQDFMNNDILYTSFWTHVVDFWRLRHEPYILFITYEEMKRDLAGVIKKLCIFLDKPTLTELELQKLLEHLSFEQMKSNEKTNPSLILQNSKQIPTNPNMDFMRRGIVGSYKDELTEEHKRQLNAWSCAFLQKHGLKEKDIFGEL